MKCFRCGRIMSFERFYGPDGYFLGWRCIYCGEIVDDVVLENRVRQKHGVTKKDFLNPHHHTDGFLHEVMGPADEDNSH